MSSPAEIKMCLEFLRTKCRINPEDESRLGIDTNIKLCIENDPPVGWYEIDLGKTCPNEWEYGYHGTPAENVGSIIRSGFVRPGNRTDDGNIIRIQPGHIQGMKFIFTSPSFHYAGHYVYARESLFDFEGKRYYVRTMFKIRQRPGSYMIKANTLRKDCWDPQVRMDDNISNDELEWVTDNDSAIMPTGLLLHFSDIPVRELYRRREEENRIKYPVQTTFEDSRNLFQTNFATDKKKILWVDDNPENNEEFTRMIRERGVEVELCLSTDSAIEKVNENGPYSYCIPITDMRRIEKREGDVNPKVYNKAGLDFMRISKSRGWDFPVYLYSIFARGSAEIMRESKEAGFEKICTYWDVEYLIERDT